MAVGFDGVLADEVAFESTRTMTQAEFARWVRTHDGWDPNHYELLSGRIVMNPPAGHPHGEIEARIVRMLGNHVEDRRLGKVFGSSQGFELPTGDTLEPDASFVSTARWRAAPKPQPGKFLVVVPELVVEILSRSTASRDRGEKRAAYERAGVRELWLIDWRAREVALFTAKKKRLGKERILSEDDTVVSKVLDGLEIDVADLLP